ncbi:hypothetical protein ACG33_00285 [Steroidobacter denitrificans]|uniref:Uncharacterized protein n=1 Tax=Steroidobacter denitrificans TaxID=465721 RepID=A0A127F535_STEDE|nr:hypothetical protein [Steroidobacter denitrificans]AMN45564.1 hypothetical protein ACG33_00285 [Steroidobacter denitrificans]
MLRTIVVGAGSLPKQGLPSLMHRKQWQVILDQDVTGMTSITRPAGGDLPRERPFQAARQYDAIS